MPPRLKSLPPVVVTHLRVRSTFRRLLLGLLFFLAVFVLLHRHLLSVQEADKPCPRKKDLVELVPNVVHFVHLDSADLPFVGFVCVLAAAANQDPERLLIHTNRPEDLSSDERFLRLKAALGERLRLVKVSKPTHVYGSPIADVSHAADVLRLQILLR